ASPAKLRGVCWSDRASTRRATRGRSAPSSTPHRPARHPAMRPIGGSIRGRFLQRVGLRRVLPGHDDEPVGHLPIGRDQREAKADVSLSAEIRGTWHGGTPPGFFCNAEASVRFPTNSAGGGPFLTDPYARSSVSGGPSWGRARD